MKNVKWTCLCHIYTVFSWHVNTVTEWDPDYLGQPQYTGVKTDRSPTQAMAKACAEAPRYFKISFFLSIYVYYSFKRLLRF
jgi:hypothetical protein